MNKPTIAISVVLAAIIAFFVTVALRPSLGGSAGPAEYFTKNFLAGYNVGSAQNTVVNAYNCVTTTWAPGTLSAEGTSTAATSTDISASSSQFRAVVGNTCAASLTSATTTSARVGCLIATNGTTTITLSNVSNATLSLATGTAKVCISQ